MAKSDSGVDKDLAAFLKKALKAKAERPLFYALVLKGSTDGKLIVNKKKVPTTAINAAKKDVGGTVVIKGVCHGEGGVIVFETAKEPAPAWNNLVKKLAKEDAGLMVKAEFRLGRDEETLPDEFPEEPGDETAETEQAEGPSPEQAQYESLRVSLSAAAARLAQTDPATAEKIQKLLAAAQGQADKGDFARAVTFLQEGGKAVAEALKGPKAAPSAAPAASPPDLAGWQAAREAVVRDLRAVAKAVADTRDPDAAKVIVALQSIIKNLTPSPITPAQIDSLEEYLADDVITAAEEVPPRYGTLKIRGPLLKALAALKG